MSVFLVGGSFAVLLPMAVYFPPLAVALVIPAFRAKALNPTGRLLNSLIWIGFSAWAVIAILMRLDWNGSMGDIGWVLAVMAALASLPVVLAHWNRFRQLDQKAPWP